MLLNRIQKIVRILFVIISLPIIIFIIYQNFINPDPFKLALRPWTDETHCKYISTFGLKKICLQTKNCLYVKTDQLASFEIPNKKFILVTGYEDTTIPDDFPEKSKEILSSSYLVKWFAENVTQESDKLKLTPIGLDYHAVILTPNPKVGPVESPVKQEQFIRNLSRKSFADREVKVYCNFLHTIRGRYGLKDRADALKQIPSALIVYENNFVPRTESWTNMVKYAFVLSPAGNGLDCHRTWEALVLGAIPIVKSGPLDPLYIDLPVLIVKEWSDVTVELLEATVADFKNKQFNYDKLTLNYWRKQFNNH